jgi:hypothetical protein
MRKTWLLMALLMALPFAARAEKVTEQAKDSTEKVTESKPVKEFESMWSNLDMAAGLGWGNYTGNLADDIGSGLAWNVRLATESPKTINYELQYIGGANAFTSLPDSDDANFEPGDFRVYTNGLQAALKLTPEIFQILDETAHGKLQTYLTGGIGITRMSVAKDTQLNPSFQSDFAGAVPLAVGLDYDVSKKFFIGARGQYDFMFDTELATAQTSDMNRVGLLFSFGANNL